MKDIKIEVDGVVLSHIYSGKTLAEAAEKFAHFKDVYIVYDRNARNHAEAIATVLNATGKVNVHGLLPIIATEELKTIETALSIDQWLLKENVDRDALLLAVGGGITTDIAGFAASIYKRGIRFAYIPTTLLSQVDAAIGGKTGVNFHWYKNMLGVIRQPEFTYVCPEVLETLPRRDFVSGAAELLKTFIIKDDGYYEKAVKLLSRIVEDYDPKEYDYLKTIASAPDPDKTVEGEPNFADEIKTYMDELQRLLSAASEVKAEIVSRDQYETGERRTLNLGHTFAHAIEWKARSVKKSITHGEAVSVGIVQAARLSEKMDLLKVGIADKIAEDFCKCGLPVEMPFPVQELEEAMDKDKKAEGGNVHFILIKNIGQVSIVDLPVAQAVKELAE